MNKRLVSLLLILLPALLPVRSLALTFPVTPALDGFGIYSSGGSVRITGPGIHDPGVPRSATILAVAVQKDGRIVIGGDFSITDGGAPLRNLARLNPDGTLDATFHPPVLDGTVRAIALQPDPSSPAQPDASHPQKPEFIIVGGSFATADVTTARNGLARIASGGALDGFDPVQAGARVVINAIALRPDGLNILAGGFFAEASGDLPYLAGFSAAIPGTGTPNWTFGVESEALSGAGQVNSILLQGEMILVGGNFGTPRSSIARYRADNGRLDDFSPLPPGGTIRSMALQTDGKIIIGGDFKDGALGRNLLARLNANGSLDAGFNVNAILNSASSYVASVVVQPDGKILLAGKFSAGSAPASHSHLARLALTGALDAAALDSAFDPYLDDAVNVIALQLDGKIVAGGDFRRGGEKAVTRLARFYPEGGLDDDLPAMGLNEMVLAISQNLDGTKIIAGLFSAIQSQNRFHFAKLKKDWTLAADIGSNSHSVNVFAPLPGGDLLVGGYFEEPQLLAVRLDPDGNPHGASVTDFNATINGLMDQPFGDFSVQEMAVLPGNPPEEGQIYLAGYTNAASGGTPKRFLSRISQTTGARDDSFIASPAVDELVMTIALLPDDPSSAVQAEAKLLVGTQNGKLLRLYANGSLDRDLTPPEISDLIPPELLEITPPNEVHAIVVQPDGQLLVAGAFFGSYKIDDSGDVLWLRNLLRLDKDGTVDQSFNIEVSLKDLALSTVIDGVVPQTDGSMIIYGAFDHVRDALGSHECQYVARITADGLWDPSFNLGLFFNGAFNPYYMARTVNLQQDGKVLVGGEFSSVSGGKSRLARYANGSATQLLSVSASEGSPPTISWMREGTGPELWRVWFEYFDADDPAAPWKFLGDARRTPPDADGRRHGWQLAVPTLAQLGGSNGKVRARGYVAGNKGSAGALMESVRVYSLANAPAPKTDQTISSWDLVKQYGDDDLNPSDPASFNPCWKAVASGLPLACSPSPDPGVATVAGDCAIHITGAGEISFTVSQDGDANFNPATAVVRKLTVNGKPATVKAEDKRVTYDGTLAALTARGSDFLPGDLGPGRITFSVATPGKNADTYRIDPVVSGPPALLANYQITPVSGTFIIDKALVTVTADNKARSYGAANPQLTKSYSGFAAGENESLVSGTPLLATDAAPESPVGTYRITLTDPGMTLSARNYSFELKEGILTVLKSCQEILFPPPGERTFGDPPFELHASACSGLGIAFSSSDPGVAQISGNMVTITGAGSVLITASQAGGDNLDGALSVSRTVVVHPRGQTIGFGALARKVLGDPPFTMNATASSGLPVSYQVSDPGVAEIHGNTVTLKGAGTTVITASQPGGGNFNEALPVSQPLTVAQEGVAPLLALSTLATGSVTANPVLNIMGTASDASGITSLTVNGADLTSRAALFSSAVPLGAGENSVEVTACDGAGNRTTQALSITLDAAAPEISLRAPADNSVTGVPLFTASGTVTPGSDLTLGVNGAALQILTVSDGAFTGSGYLEPGVNTIEISAALSGRVAKVKRSVTLAPGQPSAAITEPVEDIRTEQGSLTLRGTVAGEGCSVVLDVAGKSFSPAILEGSFQQVVALEHFGEFPITASVTDSGGNSSVAQRNVIRVERILGDLDADGCVDIRDAALALRISLGMEQASAGALAHGDVAPLVDGVPLPDGKIDVGDLLVILRKIVGLVDF
jgi:uncharacterized delta-60 repeat protein